MDGTPVIQKKVKSAKKGSKLPPTKVHLYDKDLVPLLKGIKPAPFVFGIPDEDGDEEEDQRQKDVFSIGNWAQACSSCGGVKFDSLEDQRQHYKLDWHRFNLKKRLEGEPSVTEQQFEKILEEDEAKEDDNLSISGTDTEDDDETSEEEYDPAYKVETETAEEVPDQEREENDNVSKRHRHPWLYFQNAESQLMSVHKCLFAEKRSELLEDDVALVSLIPEAIKSQKWAVFMLGGGHFAGAVFDGKNAILHKTFHCYTVRAKQGGSQSAADKSGGKHKSAGASLRRYNEMALIQHVQDIVLSLIHI